MNEFWQHCSALLERELTPQQYVTWIKPLAPVAFDAAANTLQIAAPNRFKLDWVKSQFSGRITDMARDFWQSPVDVQFVLDPKAGMRAPQPAAAAPRAPLASAPAQYEPALQAAQAPAYQATPHTSQQTGHQASAANPAGPNSALAAAQLAQANAAAAAAARDDAADLDLPSLDANEAAAGRRSWRPGQSAAAAAAANGGEPDPTYERSKLNPVLTFDNFVTGKANQ
ncbi:MAG TPA: DnaA N-terminal domain-containing protein, partial [Paraburkholderia sp.]|uniref:DnaA N-terminal domain-containing protein n=1 Tax=Paraburkholderia sp. TaxID=1926495 RepID=UPI002DF660B9|nr:DnaA N-terminal domain-containing protein [Paraburkholderia sp.]